MSLARTSTHTPARSRIIAALVAAVVVIPALASFEASSLPASAAEPGITAGLDLSAGNRRAPVSGLYDWSKAGYRGGQNLPNTAALTPRAACDITAAEMTSAHGVIAGDGVDDTAGIQAAIDAIRTQCSASAGFADLSRITLPAGRLDVSRELHLDADYLVIRGAGASAGSGTTLVYRPDVNTRYDTVTPDGSEWDKDGMEFGQGSGGWLWPGRGLFRVQSRGVHTAYASDYAAAPANRKDLFEGTVNVQWKVGIALRAKTGDAGYAARAGDTVVHLATNGAMTNLGVGALVNIRAANSIKFYETQKATPTTHPLQNLHMRQQIFRIVASNATTRTITLDKPLEYDVPVNSTSDGSASIGGTVYASKASPIVDPVVGVGIESLAFTQEVAGVTPAAAAHNYGNLAPDQAMHGIVFKWAVDSWVRGIRAEMTGSHPIVTEEAKNLQIVDNQLDGSWNKGKGGNGYFRGSRVWDSVYAGNTSRNLRHFTFQWSASGNVVIGNDFDSDLNLHGGWERNNLFELNKVTVPYAHRSGNCTSNCGEEGGGGPDNSNWYPIWWGAGQKAVKWSGSSGPRNVFFNNDMSKQLGSDSAAYTPYLADRHRILQFGWSGTAWRHLDVGGTAIADWASRETLDYGDGHGVHDDLTDAADSLFLVDAGDAGPGGPGGPGNPGNPTAVLISQGRPATASSVEGSAFAAAAAVDASSTTRWASAEGVDPQWITVDLGAGATVSRVVLNWEAAYASKYKVQISADGTTWTTLKDETAGNGGTDDLTGLSGAGRYLRVHGTARGTAYGYSLWDLQVYGTAGTPGPVDPGPGTGAVVDVDTAAELSAALTAAEPGQTIKLAAGTYRGSFVATDSGTAAKPITLTGPRNAIIINNGSSGTLSGCPQPTAGWNSGYGLWLFGASYWNVKGVTVAESKKGIVLDAATHVTIDDVLVRDMQEEGVHFRRSSADGTIRDSEIIRVGLVKPGYGEGVYLGSANSNFDCFADSSGFDRSDRVQVLDNTFGPGIAAEHIDVKEGTQSGVIRGNQFNGTGISGENSADSWIDVKGNGYLIEGNSGTFSSPGTFANGYETHNPLTGFGCGNIWRSNTSDLGGVGKYAVFISSTSKCSSNPNKVYASNTVANAVTGLTNVTVTP
ncbi:discoidin domain-containing protein [Microbacterium sp. PMB16]|uniref:discoidin domain-containing protein n=1 Tax=Microbacterium sp. PMB16 TaxID=3120157 RepID=UPI003F4C188C